MPKFRLPTLTMTTDIAIFTIRDERLEILLIQRGNPPFQGNWALPGGLVEEDEDLDVCARRELEEETGVTDVSLEQLHTFGAPHRDPRGRLRHRRLLHPGPARSIEAQGGVGCGQRPLVRRRRAAVTGVRPRRDHRHGPPTAAGQARRVRRRLRFPPQDLHPGGAPHTGRDRLRRAARCAELPAPGAGPRAGRGDRQDTDRDSVDRHASTARGAGILREDGESLHPG